MTATRADVATTLRRWAYLIEHGKVPVPSACWPVSFCAGDDVCDIAGMEAIARELGVQEWQVRESTEEDGTPWAELTGSAGGVGVRITADTGARVLEPLSDEGAIIRSYAGSGGVR